MLEAGSRRLAARDGVTSYAIVLPTNDTLPVGRRERPRYGKRVLRLSKTCYQNEIGLAKK